MAIQIVDRFPKDVIVVAAIKTHKASLIKWFNKWNCNRNYDRCINLLITTTLVKRVNAASDTANTNIQLVTASGEELLDQWKQLFL